MGIVAVDVFPTRMTLRDPIPMASGVIASTGNVLVRLRTDDGLEGWGEGVEAPALTGQTQADIVEDVNRLAPLVIGADPMRRTELWVRMRAALPAASTAIGAVDIAIHDLAGKALGVPVHQLIGGAVRQRVPALTLVGSGDTVRDTAKLASRFEEGFAWFKVKLGMAAPEVEWATLERAVDIVGDRGVICGDANEAWDEQEAARFLSPLDGERIRFVEQPVPRADLAALLRLAAQSPVRLCADESAGDLASVARFAASALGGVSLKLIKHGGITGVMRGAAVCSASGLAVNLAGKVIESSISAAANLHCAAAMDAVDYGCSPANRGVELDVTDQPITVENGDYQVPSTPGLGVEVDERLVARLV